MAIAQETRAAAIAAEQADKAARLAPYEPHWAEKLLLSVRKAIVEQPAGFYPYFDSVYSGGGFTLGAGYRRFTGDRTHWNVAGLYSGKGYKLIEASVDLARSLVRPPRSSRHRVMARRHAGGLSRPRHRQPRRRRHGLSHAAGLRGRRRDRAAAPVAAAHGGRLVRRLHAEGSDRRPSPRSRTPSRRRPRPASA